MSYTGLIWFTGDFSPQYAIAMSQETDRAFNGLVYFSRQWWGNSQVTWIDPFLMMNMGCHI